MGSMTAVIYARVSSPEERQSTERQVKDLSDYALYKQMDVRKEAVYSQGRQTGA